MDDIKLYAKKEKELETRRHAFRIYSHDIFGMKFGIEKCAMLVMKYGNRHMTDGMELPSQVLGITHLFPHNEIVHLPYIAVAINSRAD